MTLERLLKNTLAAGIAASSMIFFDPAYAAEPKQKEKITVPLEDSIKNNLPLKNYYKLEYFKLKSIDPDLEDEKIREIVRNNYEKKEKSYIEKSKDGEILAKAIEYIEPTIDPVIQFNYALIISFTEASGFREYSNDKKELLEGKGDKETEKKVKEYEKARPDSEKNFRKIYPKSSLSKLEKRIERISEEERESIMEDIKDIAGDAFSLEGLGYYCIRKALETGKPLNLVLAKSTSVYVINYEYITEPENYTKEELESIARRELKMLENLNTDFPEKYRKVSAIIEEYKKENIEE